MLYVPGKFNKIIMSFFLILFICYWTADTQASMINRPKTTLFVLFELNIFNYTVFSSISGGFTTFQNKFPLLCLGNNESDDESQTLGLQSLRISDCDVSEDSEDSGSANSFPVEVLPYLYLGNAKNSADMDCLKKHNIKYILNVTHNVPNTFENNDSLNYMQISISDHWSQNLSVFFPKAIAFIGK